MASSSLPPLHASQPASFRYKEIYPSPTAPPRTAVGVPEWTRPSPVYDQQVETFTDARVADTDPSADVSPDVLAARFKADLEAGLLTSAVPLDARGYPMVCLTPSLSLSFSSS